MAALVLAATGRLDFKTFLFCNVGADSEHPATLAYLEAHAKPYAAANGLDLIELGRVKRDGSSETLYGRLTKAGSRSLPIPVRMSNGAPGTRSCTADFKIKVVAKWLKQHGATKAAPAITGLGISMDEFQRMRTDSGIAHQTLEYPLIAMRLSVQDCIKIIESAGLPVPPKSACYFCPFHRPAEWTRMRREEPELFQKSVELQRQLNARRVQLGKDPVWLTRFGRPLDVAIGDQSSLFDMEGDTCESGYCMV